MLQVRSNKAEEEVAELMKKSTQLESELDKTKEELVWSCNYEKETMNICLFKGDDHSEVGRQGEGFVGGRVGSEHPEQVTLVQLGRVLAPIHDKILLLKI